MPGNVLGNGDKVINETQCQHLGLSRHDHQKGMDGTSTFSNRTLLTYWKGSDSPGWAICPSKKKVKYSLPKSPPKKSSGM